MGSTICVRCGANLKPHSYCNVCHGFWLEEFTSPYYEFIDNGYEVTLASPKGGKPPVDPKSLKKENQSESTQRFEKDESAQKRLENTIMLNQLTASDFDTLFLPGGHGPMWDLSADIDIKQLVKDCYSDYKIISTVCHGPAGLLQAIDQNGNSILKNKKVTGFTNDEENSVGLTKVVPFLLEDRMKELGGKFERGQDFKQFVVSDGRLITGQNQVCISCYRKSGRSSWKAIKPFGCLRILTESKRIIL